MQCPNCYSAIPTGSSICARCSHVLNAALSPWLTYSEQHQPAWQSETDQSQATGVMLKQNIKQHKLLAEQQQTLRMKALGALIIALSPIGFVIYFLFQYRHIEIFSDSIVTIPLTIITLMGIGISILFIRTGLVLQLFQDAQEGIALEQMDMLEKTYHITARGRITYYGYFHNLGWIRLTSEQYLNCTVNLPYYVHYSPRSKHIWQIRPVNPGY